MTTISNAPLAKNDFKSDQDVRWCPGCGDYGILNAVQSAFAKLGKNLHDTVVISGIGCSSRFPYYMETYGFHTIHGRAPALATGTKTANPALDVWVVTGDGDSLSIGGNHFIHVLRRNVGLKILLFNNRIYGLTKGQYSPTSETGKRTKSTPNGSVDAPFNPLAVALGAGATFVARSADIFQAHLKTVLKRAAAHRGSAFVEIYQNCNIFNDKAFAYVTDKEARTEGVVYLEHGKPVVFGSQVVRGIRHTGSDLEVVEIGNGVTADGCGVTADDCLVWDESRSNPSLAFQLAHMDAPDFPVPMGVLRAVEAPVYEQGVIAQIREREERLGGTLESLIYAGDTWQVGS